MAGMGATHISTAPSIPGATDTHGSAPLAARFLERALLITILAHAVAMLTMALLLLPGMPGGGNPDDAARVAYVAAHPWLWRLGWLPWQITALSDIVLALALVRTAWIPRVPAALALLTTVIAVSIEQPGELRWVTQGVALAQAAVRDGDLSAYLRFEAGVYPQVAAWAATMYTVTALGWTWCFAGAGIWNRRLAWLSIVTWSLLLAVSVGPLLPQGYRPSVGLIAAGNAIGFVLLIAWLIAVTELVLRRSRPGATHGRMAAWVHPRQGLFGQLLGGLAASRLARAFGEWLPPVAFVSDITNVIYVNYLVEAERLAPLVPWGLELQRLGPAGKYALFTHLTYQHGHFGPRLLGPLRRLLPSPIQSNWRIHVRDPQTEILGIYFVTTAISHTAHALLARLLSEGIPMHVAQRGEVLANPDGSFQVRLDPGRGSAPDMTMLLRPTTRPTLAPPWSEYFESFHDLLAYCVPQDRAMSSQPWYRRVTRQEIQLGIPLESCEPLTAEVVSAAARTIVGDAQPVCFRVAQVAFRFDREEYDIRSS
jgi:hypothetical protein